MKIQYTFTVNLEEVHEVLFEKIDRVLKKAPIQETIVDLRRSLIKKEELKRTKNKIENCLENLERVKNELEECLMFVGGLQDYLSNSSLEKAPVENKPTEEKPQTEGDPQESLDSLRNLAQSLKNMQD